MWTVNPRRDSLGELLQRIRYYASEACSSQEIALYFEAPNSADDRRADSEVRHDVYLIAKEAIHNAVRHSGCTQIRIEIVISPASLDMRIADNGRGLYPEVRSGNGLQSVRYRAAQLRGKRRMDYRREGRNSRTSSHPAEKGSFHDRSPATT